MSDTPKWPHSLSPLVAPEHPASVAYRVTLSPHEWKWTQTEQEDMACALVQLDEYRCRLERELAEARAEIVRLKRPIRCHDVDEFYREDAAPGGEVKP